MTNLWTDLTWPQACVVVAVIVCVAWVFVYWLDNR